MNRKTTFKHTMWPKIDVTALDNDIIVTKIKDDNAQHSQPHFICGRTKRHNVISLKRQK